MPGLTLKGEVTMAVASIAVCEGLIRQLDPSFDMMKSAGPYFWRFRDSPFVKALPQ